jgi:hypothetical protein
MVPQYHCSSPRRVEALRLAAERSPPLLLNGIEYLEVAPDHTTLEVHFVHDLALAPQVPLRPANVEIRGGVRIRNPKVTRVVANGNVLTVHVAASGDFSRYRLRLAASSQGAEPPAGIDPALAQIEFSFKVDCPSPFDCKTSQACPPVAPSMPQIDYLAKDYESFRRLMLDRLAALIPQWTERSPADLMVTLVELLAYRADQLSYYQDAVAAEAYLGTARRRISVRRHARLLDYAFDDGANARTWVAFEVQRGGAADGLVLQGCDPTTGLGGTLLLTKVRGMEHMRVIDDAMATKALAAGSAQPFELLQDLELHAAHNRIRFHTWSGEECCLPKGATRCFFIDPPSSRLQLKRGDFVLFEEVKHAVTGEPADADRTHRHVVRLTAVTPEAGAPPRSDPVTGDSFVEIQWAEADALPFPLCVSARVEGTLVNDIAVARANIALADYGRSIAKHESLRVEGSATRFRPLLTQSMIRPLTMQRRVRRAGSVTTVLVDDGAPASSVVSSEVGPTLAAIDLRSAIDGARWVPRPDLIDSGRFDLAFVVETEEDGRSYLRFGDDINARRPKRDDSFTVTYRIGNGSAGNIGAEALHHLVGAVGGIERIRNPLAAQGGRESQPIDQVKLYAPQAFRRQERAVTLEDYARTAQLHPQVQRAIATRRWTGSWHTTFLTVDRVSGAGIDAQFEAELRRFLERYRLTGHDLEIDGPRFVALDLAFDVCTQPDYFPADVQQRLLQTFASGVARDGTIGFFHPDRFTFGAAVSLSEIIARAMHVPGVGFVTPRRFQRWGRTAVGELEAGVIAMGRLEVARLDNDANAPENGRIEFTVHAEKGARRS